MVKTPEKVCAFCGQKGGGELGGLQNTSDESILAHHDCLIFSPQVFTNDLDEFDIDSVREEIKRGKTLKCSHCKNPGATIGCDVKICRKTYHYMCVQKDGGVTDEDKYIAYCSKHTRNSNAAKDSKRPKKLDHLLTSHKNEKPGKRKRESPPGNYPSKRVIKRRTYNEEQDSDSGSELSELPSTSYEERTPKRNRNSSPRLHFNKSLNRTRSTGDDSEDEQSDTNDTSSGVTASPMTQKNWRGSPRNQKRRLGAASTQNSHNSISNSVDPEDGQQSDGDGESEVMGAQVRDSEREEIECNEESSSSPNQPLFSVCFPTSCQQCSDKHEEYFAKLYESQSRVADSIDSGVREFRNFAQQFQSLFKQFLDICQSLNHGIISNLTNTQGRNASMEGPSQINSHGSTSAHDSAKDVPDVDTTRDTLSSENTHPSKSEESIRKPRHLPVKKNTKLGRGPN